MISICSYFNLLASYSYLYVIFAVSIAILLSNDRKYTVFHDLSCYTGAGVECDPKQQATAEFIDNMSIHYCIASMLNIQSRDKIL